MSKTGNFENQPQFEAARHGSEKPMGVYESFMREWQTQAHTVRIEQSIHRNGNDNTASKHIPELRITGESEQVRDIKVTSKSGASDTLAGINPRPGETLPHLIKRLHPDLSEKQLASEVQKVLKYNRDYGNDIGDGSALDADKAVFLTSVKYVDEKGRITKIEGPTGRVTEVVYDAKGISAFKITEADGRVSEVAGRDADGKWTATRDGKTVALKDVEIDIYGDITTTDNNGNTSGHLTRGDDIHTQVQDGKPIQSVTIRDGKQSVVFEYEVVPGGTQIFARYPEDPGRRVALNSVELMKRLVMGTGHAPELRAGEPNTASAEPAADVAPDAHMANRIARAAYQEARSRNTTGWCYSGVADALDNLGINLYGESAYMAKGQLLRDKRFAVVSLNDLKPGDVLVHGKSAGHEHGHIAVYLGNGQEASDHVQGLIRGQGYGGTTVFRYVG